MEDTVSVSSLCRLLTPGPYFAGWHSSPVTPFGHVINFNLMKYPGAEPSLLSVLENQQATLDRTENTENENLGATGAYFRSVLSLGQYRYDVDDVVADPVATLFYPIFDSFQKEDRSVVAVFAASLLWKHYFADILPSTVQGMICVMSNSAGQKFSYRLDGHQPKYLGDGDFHDMDFDHMRKAGFLSEYLEQSRRAESLSYTSVPVNFEQFDYKVEIYPSADTQAIYVSNAPWIASLVIALIFTFTGAIFVTYSIFVDRRQGILMRRAIASGAIVSSLFPAQVRDQLYKETQQAQPSDNKAKHGQPRDKNDGAPIAQKFEETSIIFADIKGFTHWSSQRSPEDVFMLLETLYGAFGASFLQRGCHFLTSRILLYCRQDRCPPQCVQGRNCWR